MLECSARKTVVIIGGMVGAGKSTLINELKDMFLREEICILRMTAFSGASYLFFSFLATFFYNRRVVKLYKRVGIHPSTLVVKRIRRVSLAFLLITILLEIISVQLRLIYVLIKCRHKRIILVDEGFINAVANYVEVLGEKSSMLMHYIFSILNNWRCKYKLTLVFLSVNNDVLKERWLKRKRPLLTRFIGLDHHFRYLKLMKLSSRLFVKSGFNVLVIDTSNRISDEVAEEVAKTLFLLE